jgi:HAE1 family hydrophobic/amphiphilic exporter-1
MSKGSSSREAAIDTLITFQTPLIAGTLTTIFVFLPMLLMTGIIGKYVRSIPVTVTVVLTAAIIVSFGFLTTFAVRFLKVKQGQSGGGLKKVKEWIDAIYLWYGKTLNAVLKDKSKRRKFLGIVAILFFLAIALPAFGIVKVEMFPSEDLDSISISIENPVGTPLSITNAMVEEIEAVLLEDTRVENFVSRVGSGSSVGMLGSAGVSSHKANITVNLDKKREESSQKISLELENTFKKLVSAEVIVGQEAGGPPQGAPVQMKVLGDSLTDLEEAARILAGAISEIEGTRNIDTGIPEGNGELVFEINRAKTRNYGVSEFQVAQEIRAAITGSSATTIQKNGEDIDVVVRTRLGQNERAGGVNVATVEDIKAITVSTPNFGAVPISSFGDVVLAPSRSSISHEDGNRVLSVTADVVSGANSQVIVGEISSKIPSLGLPNSVSVTFGGEAEDIAESFTSLGQAMIIGILAIFGLLVWQFKSYRQPLFVLVTIPLALIGVFFGLAISNNPISFPGFIGIVALAGIVVNNAIILIDAINSDRISGLNIQEAIESSAKSRLQPIILTTLTTVAGMIPLALSSPVWAPIAISIMSGLLFSTVLTLFVIPILYLSFGEKELQEIN